MVVLTCCWRASEVYTRWRLKIIRFIVTIARPHDMLYSNAIGQLFIVAICHTMIANTEPSSLAESGSCDWQYKLVNCIMLIFPGNMNDTDFWLAEVHTAHKPTSQNVSLTVLYKTQLTCTCLHLMAYNIWSFMVTIVWCHSYCMWFLLPTTVSGTTDCWHWNCDNGSLFNRCVLVILDINALASPISCDSTSHQGWMVKGTWPRSFQQVSQWTSAACVPQWMNVQFISN